MRIFMQLFFYDHTQKCIVILQETQNVHVAKLASASCSDCIALRDCVLLFNNYSPKAK